MTMDPTGVGMVFGSTLGPQDNSDKERFMLGFPTQNVVILMVTITGWGIDPWHVSRMKK